MAIQFEILEAEALKLGSAERARLAEHLIASLDADAEIEKAWAVEVEQRLVAVDNGSAKLVPAADALARVRAALK